MMVYNFTRVLKIIGKSRRDTRRIFSTVSAARHPPAGPRRPPLAAVMVPRRRPTRDAAARPHTVGHCMRRPGPEIVPFKLQPASIMISNLKSVTPVNGRPQPAGPMFNFKFNSESSASLGHRMHRPRPGNIPFTEFKLPSGLPVPVPNSNFQVQNEFRVSVRCAQHI